MSKQMLQLTLADGDYLFINADTIDAIEGDEDQSIIHAGTKRFSVMGDAIDRYIDYAEHVGIELSDVFIDTYIDRFDDED